jgi:hypothetical protein
MSKRYVNAKDVFPEELLLAMSKAVGGSAAQFYLPRYEELIRPQRIDFVWKLFESGVTVPKIAERLGVGERTVWRMLKQARESKEKPNGKLT